MRSTSGNNMWLVIIVYYGDAQGMLKKRSCLPNDFN